MAAFGSRVGTSAATISRVANNTVTARMSLVKRIYEETGGQVTPNDLAGLYCKTPCHVRKSDIDGRWQEINESDTFDEQ